MLAVSFCIGPVVYSLNQRVKDYVCLYVRVYTRAVSSAAKVVTDSCLSEARVPDFNGEKKGMT